MGLYAFLQINVMIQAYSNPVRQINNVVLPILALPGLLVCMPFSNFSDQSQWGMNGVSPASLTFFSDPRTGFAPFTPKNTPAFPDIPVLIDCCYTAFSDFFVDCFTKAKKCAVKAYQIRNFAGTFPTSIINPATNLPRSWYIYFDCLQVSPGITFQKDSDQLYIPFFVTMDTGVIAMDMNSQWWNDSSTDSNYDPLYRQFCDNSMFWPKKFTMFSFEASENQTSITDIYFGVDPNIDLKIGGSQNRIRTDLGRGITSCYIYHFAYWDIEKRPVISSVGWSTSYDLTLGTLPWIAISSQWPQAAAIKRMSIVQLGWMRIHLTMAEQQTREAVLFTYLDLATTILSIIGSAAALTHICVGPGDYDPKGLLNKIFYNDVPVLKNAATDMSSARAAAEAEKDKNKKKQLKKAKAKAMQQKAEEDEDQEEDE